MDSDTYIAVFEDVPLDTRVAQFIGVIGGAYLAGKAVMFPRSVFVRLRSFPTTIEHLRHVVTSLTSK